MDPRAEADLALGGRFDPRVLEPSPPAVHDPPWFADDAVARGAGDGRPVVSPVPGRGDLTWEEVAAGDAGLEAFCRERWLGPWNRLAPLSEGFAHTRVALHGVAERILKPAREGDHGKFGLRFTRGGFGTPFFGGDTQVRIQDGELVVVEDGRERRGSIQSLRASAELAGLSGAAALPADPLDVDADAAAALGDWYGFAASVLETLRAEAGAGAEPSRVQLWPEHFDMAVELGAQDAGRRAAYGCSPGDDTLPEPYVYVAPWGAFPSSQLTYAELLAAPDQRAAALDFLRTRLHRALSVPPDG
ncbi:MAG: hypothetical protein QOE65_1937 [Solirubrobacteraceae bacterium]|jgi:hypothetical protein|nr:hypothetical protein [Solirubrobacteraceae bacterium]